MEFIDPKIEDYCIEHSSAPSELCAEIQNYTLKNEHWSKMLTGKMEASLLGLLLRSIRAKRVLEFGTYTGYSALNMAEHLPEDGELITIDKDARVQELAKTYWERSAHNHKIKPVLSEGVSALEQIQGHFDFVFIDADKVSYRKYFEFALERLTPRGMIAIDNVLWSGRVLEESTDKSTLAIQQLNTFIGAREDLYKTLLPIRDGIFLIQKLV